MKISRKQAREVLYDVLNKELKVRWAKMCMDFIRGIINFGLNKDIISGENHFAKLGIPQGTKEQKLWNPEDVEKFCTTANEMGKPEYALAVRLNLYLSNRPADYLKLRVSDIKKDENGYYFETISNKTKVKSFAYFPEELYRQIDKNKDKLIDTSLAVFQRNFRKIVLKAGLDGCTFKNIRNTAITKYFEAGASIGEVTSISGHKKAETALNIYRQNSKKQSFNAFEKCMEQQNGVSMYEIVDMVLKAMTEKNKTQQNHLF